jgi:hypothetical protein
MHDEMFLLNKMQQDYAQLFELVYHQNSALWP